MSGKKYPIGVPLTEFGNQLADKKYDSVNSEWQELYFGSAFIGITLDDAEYMQEQLEVVEEKVIFVFDFAITAVSLFKDFIFFLPNFMNAVITYIAGILYNALDSLLRLGVYSLIVTPNLSDVGSKGMPTTNLREQADNAYKKFYDYSDPNLPYSIPFVKGLSEDIIDSGEKMKNKYKYYFEDSALAGNLNPSGEKRPYMETDFTDFKKSVENLEKPGGLYDAIYLYFSVDYGATVNTDTIIGFLAALAGMSDLFKFGSIEGLLKEYDSLFKPKRKQLNILCTDKIPFPNGMTRSVKSDVLNNLRKVDIETNKQTFKDPVLENFRIFESNPTESLTPEKKAKLTEHFQEQLDQANQMKDIASNQEFLESQVESRFYDRLNTNDEYQKVLARIDGITDEIEYYNYRTEILNFQNSISPSTTNSQFLNQIKTFFDENNPDYTVAASGQVFNNPTNFTKTVTFFRTVFELYETELQVISFFSNELSQDSLFSQEYFSANGIDPNNITDVDRAIIEMDAVDRDNSITTLKNRILDLAASIRLQSDFTITPPDLAQTARKQELEDLIEQQEKIGEQIRDNVEASIKENITDRIQKIVDEKQSQLDMVSSMKGNSEDIITDLTKSAQIAVFDNYYPNNKRGTLYQSYLEKFYNFTSISNADYVYKLTVEIDAMPDDFSTKQDSFHSGQFVQIRENVGSDSNPQYEYRGSGIIIDGTEKTYEDAGTGSWSKINFTDMIGITADIKRLQNEVLGFQNLFEPNTAYFDIIINFLKDIKKRILEVIFIIKELIKTIQKLLSIQFKTAIWGKYVRERESYDLLAKGLTDTTNLNLPRKKSDFNPKNLSTVQSLLAKIREISPADADRISDNISVLAAKVSDSEDEPKKRELSEKSIIEESYPPSYIENIKTNAENLASAIKNELINRADTLTAAIEIGSSKGADLAPGVVAPEDAEDMGTNIDVLFYEAQIYSAIRDAEDKLTEELGISLILLSYLPVGLPFYPVRFLAERLGLYEQDPYVTSTDILVNNKGQVPPYALNTLDVGTIDSLMPNYGLSDLQGMMIDKSINRSPTVWHKPKPNAISVNLEPLVATEDFVFDLDDVSTLENDSSFLSVGGNSIKILRSMQTKYLAGAKLVSTSGNPFTIGKGNDTLNSNYKYLYEFTLDSGPNSTLICSADETVDLDKIQVHFGVFVEGQSNITKKAFDLNGNGNQIFRFGRRTLRKFRGELYLKQDKSVITPYILIGYDGLASLQNFNFQLQDKVIYLYRVA